jgi:hypothetical protein
LKELIKRSGCFFGLAREIASPFFIKFAFFARFFSIEIVLVGAQVFSARFISIAFGGRMALVDVPRFNRIAFLAA